MDKIGIRNTRISDIVDQNYVYAYVLFYFGIRFYEYSEHTLEEVCKLRNLRIDQVIKELESPVHIDEADLPLISYPIDLIIEYLKHAHYLFIKNKLPYIAKLVEALSIEHHQYKRVVHDLKIVFPLFVEDFIHHIYEEEDTLFVYIKALEQASRNHYHPGKIYYMMEENSIHKFAVEHEAHDDEMEGIRKITNDYAITVDSPLHIKVLYNELKDFEKNLITHARIENEILFPKVMLLENKVKTAYFERAKLN